MSNENYVNYYVEILTSTMTDAVIRNVSLQANAKISNEIIETQAKEIEELKQTVETGNNVKDVYVEQLKLELKQKNENIDSLNNQIKNLNSMKNEYENVKHQVNHLDTFRNELIKERESHQNTRNEYEKQIEKLNKQIEKLKPSPVKKVKLGEVNKIFTDSKELETITKDGGSF